MPKMRTIALYECAMTFRMPKMRTIALYNRTWPTECQRLELLHFITVHYYRMPKMRAIDIYNRLYCRWIVPLCFIRCIVARSLFYYIRHHLVSQSDCCFIFCFVCSALYPGVCVVFSLFYYIRIRPCNVTLNARPTIKNAKFI